MNLKGYIIPNDYVDIFRMMKIDATSPGEVEAWLKSDDPDKTLRINSGGGSMFAGIEMYSLIKEHGAVNVFISGEACSAASIAAIAGRTVKISPPAMMMIHNVSMGARGDKNAMKHAAMSLDECDSAISQAYQLKTGLDESVLLDLMNKETWMSAKKAKSYGFVDEIAFEKGQEPQVFNAKAQLAVNINTNLRRNITNGLARNA